MNEIVFEVTQGANGGFVAECLSDTIVTQADRWEELRGNVLQAVDAFFFDKPKPASIRLHLVRDEVLTAQCNSRATSAGMSWSKFCVAIGVTGKSTKRAAMSFWKPVNRPTSESPCLLTGVFASALSTPS